MSKSHKHFQAKLVSKGPLSKIKSMHLPAFVHFVVCMKTDMRMSKVHACLRDVHGVTSWTTMSQWYIILTDAFEKYLREVEGLQLGGADRVVVIDETYARAKRVTHKRGVPGRKQGRRSGHIQSRLPGRTVWKRPAQQVFKKPAAMKKPAAVMKKPSLEKRWLWGAVDVGPRDGAPATHGHGNKRVHLSLLPQVADAPEHKPRGAASLAQKMHDAILSGTFVVSDEWAATAPAVQSCGLRLEGQVSHEHSFRDPESGIHSNDIESEFARFKLWMQTKFASYRIGNQSTEAAKRAHLARKLVEYVFYTNVGRTMSAVMEALMYASQ